MEVDYKCVPINVHNIYRLTSYSESFCMMVGLITKGFINRPLYFTFLPIRSTTNVIY